MSTEFETANAIVAILDEYTAHNKHSKKEEGNTFTADRRILQAMVRNDLNTYKAANSCAELAKSTGYGYVTAYQALIRLEEHGVIIRFKQGNKPLYSLCREGQIGKDMSRLVQLISLDMAEINA